VDFAMTTTPSCILFCNCTYAQVIPREVRQAVLAKLCEAGVSFEAVADLCELSARRDPSLKRLAQGGPVKIAACFPRAVKGLFGAAGAPLNADVTEVLNMRVQSAEEIFKALMNAAINPNLSEGKEETPAPETQEEVADPARP
jgi:hypothetical protein